jgi:hypothetical protein
MVGTGSSSYLKQQNHLAFKPGSRFFLFSLYKSSFFRSLLDSKRCTLGFNEFDDPALRMIHHLD